MIRLSTPALLQFYKEWLEHAESEHAHEFFFNSVGLCRNLENWVEHRSKCILDKYDGYDAIDQMKLQFEDAGRGYVYPFSLRKFGFGCVIDDDFPLSFPS